MITRIFLVILFVVVTCFTHAQEQKRVFFTEAAIGAFKWSTNSCDLHSHPFIGNIRAGYSAKNRWAYGVEYHYLGYKKAFSQRSRLQQPGTNWTETGTIADIYRSIGVFAEYQVKTRSRLTCIPGVYLHYLTNSFTNKSQLYENGVPTGITLEEGTLYGYVARAGLSLTWNYTISPTTAVSFRILEWEHRFGKYKNELFLAVTPILGIRYFLRFT